MVESWSDWKSYPKAEQELDAPVGPGLYELRSSPDGEFVAFGHSGNVARTLITYAPRPKRLIDNFFSRRIPERLEYRTCTAATLRQAAEMKRMLSLRRSAAWRLNLGRRANISVAGS